MSNNNNFIDIVNEMMNELFDFKEKISDADYKSQLENLSKLRKKYLDMEDKLDGKISDSQFIKMKIRDEYFDIKIENGILIQIQIKDLLDKYLFRKGNNIIRYRVSSQMIRSSTLISYEDFLDEYKKFIIYEDLLNDFREFNYNDIETFKTDVDFHIKEKYKTINICFDKHNLGN